MLHWHLWICSKLKALKAQSNGVVQVKYMKERIINHSKHVANSIHDQKIKKLISKFFKSRKKF